MQNADGWSVRNKVGEPKETDKIEQTEKQVKVEPEVIVKLAEVIENKKIQINTSLDEYLSEADYVTTGRLEILKLIAENECKICDEILGDVKSKFSE